MSLTGGNMKTNALKVGFAALLACFISLSSVATAAIPDLSENMTQGQFAIWLVNAIGASDKLPAAPSEEDAIDLLKKLNIIPTDGWSKNTVITKQFLASLLGDESAANLDFKELIARIQEFADGRFEDANLGIFRAFGSSASGSVTI